MKRVMLLSIMIFSINALFAQSSNVARNKVKTNIENLNKEMEKVFNANDMGATAV